MKEKIKDIIQVFIILSYIFLIGALIVNNGHFIFKEKYLLGLNIILLCIGFYNFVKNNT
jgi:hypothetical protein